MGRNGQKVKKMAAVNKKINKHIVGVFNFRSKKLDDTLTQTNLTERTCVSDVRLEGDVEPAGGSFKTAYVLKAKCTYM